MTCRSMTPDALAAWIDGGMEPARARDVACHVATCPSCNATAEKLRAQTDTLRRALGQEKAPAHLLARISGQMAAEPAPQSRWAGLRGQVSLGRRQLLGGAVAASLLGGIAIHQLVPMPGDGPEPTLKRLAVETAQDYMTFRISQRSLDVASEDPTETLVWLDARVNGALPDMAETIADYRLIGGRLCWLMGQRLGALTYARGDNQVTVYVLPAPPGTGVEAPVHHVEGPFHSTAWVEAGLLIAVVSDLSEGEQARVVDALGQALRSSLLET